MRSTESVSSKHHVVLISTLNDTNVITDMSVSSMSTTSTTSSEDSIAPFSGRPHNFGVVVPGVYRSSYPKAGDFEYIKGLKLKTLV